MQTILRVDRNFTWKDVCDTYAHAAWKWFIDNVGFEQSILANIVIPYTIDAYNVRNRLLNCDYPRHMILESDNLPQQVYRTFDKWTMVKLTRGVVQNPNIDEFVVKFPSQDSLQRATHGGLGPLVTDSVAFAFNLRGEYEDRDCFLRQIPSLAKVINGSLYRFVWQDYKNENDIGHVGIGTLSDVIDFATKHDVEIAWHCEPNLFQCTSDIVFHPKLRGYRYYTSISLLYERKFHLMHENHFRLIKEEFQWQSK